MLRLQTIKPETRDPVHEEAGEQINDVFKRSEKVKEDLVLSLLKPD